MDSGSTLTYERAGTQGEEHAASTAAAVFGDQAQPTYLVEGPTTGYCSGSSSPPPGRG